MERTARGHSMIVQHNRYTPSSHMCVMNHNWPAKKQHLHLQSGAGISRHSALSEDRIRQCGTSSEPQGHRSMSASCHFLLQALQCPYSMRKRLSWDHCYWGWSKPGCRIVGSHSNNNNKTNSSAIYRGSKKNNNNNNKHDNVYGAVIMAEPLREFTRFITYSRWELTTWADFQLCLHLGRGRTPSSDPSPVPLTLTPTLNYIIFYGEVLRPLPQGVVFGVITATNPYYCCGIEY